ncbi:putative sarcosine oxidase [Microdochium trichocladiopsis]|uniref:Sarcosine oxidase n=1 Tax=Microdochium trichocladiopsis TaxID=1682393 RepID=A0A9P8XVA1_9PEZI|nr:putative sarcosine oxidase [Microdochium trichocladiopsis]KAH7014398.1 putative sarcosine oxidase [Microdochium trichocladiopsis]
MAVSPRKQNKIVIVGAGIFGLSTALHLAKRGYTDVTVLDRQPYHKTLYSYFAGCDGASADINKIIRSAYGSQTDYQELTFRAIEQWKVWNEELASGQCVPPGMTRDDRVFYNTGSLSFNDTPELPAWEVETLTAMDAHGHGHTQFATSDPARVAQAERAGLNIDPFKLRERGRASRAVGILDSSGGTAAADKACRFALHKAGSLGVKFILDPVAGYFESLCSEGDKTDTTSPSATGRIADTVVTGVRTRDGKTHPAALVIMACGGWTPTLVPSLDGLAEATGGSVVLIKIPRDRQDLWARFAPERFPSWMYKMRDGAEGGLYGFPRDDEGYVKIGYRGTKYTNPIASQGNGDERDEERSTPVTRWSSPSLSPSTSADDQSSRLTQIPAQAMRTMQRFVHDFLPELEPFGIAMTRMCWYTDSFDNHFVVDRVPATRGLMVATAGSGHAFKYLPILGDWVVDVVEGKKQRSVTESWKWRRLGEGATPYNVLMEGSAGPRALKNVDLYPDGEDRALHARAKL